MKNYVLTQDDIKGSKISKKELRVDCWWVKIEKTNGCTKWVEQYKYNWLLYNPTFEFIPKHYAVHHLDWDKTNDDPSNLAIMQRAHHTAHYYKNTMKQTEVEISVSPDTFKKYGYYPIGEPKVAFNKQRGVWAVRFAELYDGEKKWRSVSVDEDGNSFDTREKAEAFKATIWIENWSLPIFYNSSWLFWGDSGLRSSGFNSCTLLGHDLLNTLLHPYIVEKPIRRYHHGGTHGRLIRRPIDLVERIDLGVDAFRNGTPGLPVFVGLG